MNHSRLLYTAIVLALSFGFATTAKAATVETVHYQNASGFCQPALPVFDGNIRKRPTAVANEGTANAFVSCSMSSLPEVAISDIASVSLAVYNRAAADVNVTCSMVNSYQAGGAVVPKTLPVVAGSRTFFEWTPADFGGTALDFMNFNCNLPVGTELGYAYYFYDYEIGT